MADKDCGVESGEGFAGHGYGGLEDFAASFQLAEIVDDLSWWFLFLCFVFASFSLISTHSVVNFRLLI